jgi:protoheme IX farnesyltransferase
MVIDRDIDARMDRTARRPIPSRAISPRAATTFGLLLAVPGLALAWALRPLFGLLVSAGFALDLAVYTLWLKRRTPLSILFGGISGGMPAMAGRALALGRVDAVGVLLAIGVLLWIPSHILTLATHYAREYRLAGVPVWPNVYGPRATRRTVAAASLGAAVALGTAGWLLEIHPTALIILLLMGLGLSGMALAVLIRPSERLNWRLFKAASIYMLGSFVCLTIGAVV